ncbi:D-sedoheptulose-7-phosphate isomerase [Ostreibacterium oceani]|uniref:Phosphoheptose isomerase n=1 Tax=Ostreibacterium oceani TaxID=2654998 RepID=A0A6N7EYB1_9GAMM|nr:SIS domain-containing protein [Ostreibacterium oceani]MPV85468.1 SIS domain-containing protein [Ostreibacterium oceani]
MLSLKEKIASHIAVFEQLATIEQPIDAAAALIQTSCLDGKTVFVCGNGGSAADAQHFSAELTGRYVLDRPAYAGVALTVDTSALTAIANDYGYAQVFARQLDGLAKSGDVLVAISTSGHSANIMAAVEVAKKKQMQTIALLGRDGGQLASVADISIVVPAYETARIQEAHSFILHYFCEWLEPLPAITD